jgi:hypothetical protein
VLNQEFQHTVFTDAYGDNREKTEAFQDSKMKDFWKLVDVQLEMIRKKDEKAAKKYVAGSHLDPFAHTSTRQFAFPPNKDIKKHGLQ